MSAASNSTSRLREFYILNYRSIRELRLPLGQINVVTGPNGSGKSNLYRAVFLFSRAGHGDFARMIALEGGMGSVLCTHPGVNSLSFGLTFDDFRYEIDIGLPPPQPPPKDPEDISLFQQDPLVLREKVGMSGAKRRALFERTSNAAFGLNEQLRPTRFEAALDPTESVLSQLQAPQLYPELWLLRQRLTNWRFYHHFRTDLSSPVRQPQAGARTPILSSDGTDLAAALQTIHEFGDQQALYEALERAFPGARIKISAEPLFALRFRPKGAVRSFGAHELSDGTLRYLCLVAALLSIHPPEFLVLNEPETSLHPDLLDPLAQLIVRAAARSQIWVTTHSEQLARRIGEMNDDPPIRLSMEKGQTVVKGLGAFGFRESDK